jgi:hypothetical protein
MSRNKRKDERRAATMAAYLYSVDGWPLGEGKLKDISRSGAKLVHELAEEMPREFLLSLSRNGQVRRRCHVMWQKDDQVGVCFVNNEQA